MDKRFFIINIIFAITDTIVHLAVILGLGFAAYHFDKWWLVFFMLVPLALFNAHTLILDAKEEEVKEDAEKER